MFVQSIGGPVAAKVILYTYHQVPEITEELDQSKQFQKVFDTPPQFYKSLGRSSEECS
jgi:hypothetical protein